MQIESSKIKKLLLLHSIPISEIRNLFITWKIKKLYKKLLEQKTWNFWPRIRKGNAMFLIKKTCTKSFLNFLNKKGLGKFRSEHSVFFSVFLWNAKKAWFLF